MTRGKPPISVQEKAQQACTPVFTQNPRQNQPSRPENTVLYRRIHRGLVSVAAVPVPGSESLRVISHDRTSPPREDPRHPGPPLPQPPESRLHGNPVGDAIPCPLQTTGIPASSRLSRSVLAKINDRIRRPNTRRKATNRPAQLSQQTRRRHKPRKQPPLSPQKKTKKRDR